jgi:hypothetical protein
MELHALFTDINCQICFENFINLKHHQYLNFIKSNKKLLSENFDEDNCCHLYEDRFECLTCKNIICQKCYWSFKNHYFVPREDLIEFYEACGTLEDNGMVEGCPGEECPIICPFCRTIDYKIFYNNKIPYELLNEIKKKESK